MADKTRVIGYVRVSTEIQASEGVSLDAQQARLRAYAAALDLELVRIEQDAGHSAKNLDRPALKSALRALDEGQATGLLVFKLDRLTRRVLDLGHLIERYFGERFSLLSVADSIDTRTAAGRLVLNVMASAAQWEGSDARNLVFGWTRDGRRTPQPVPSEQATVRRAVELRRRGCSLPEIVSKLNTEGRATQRGGSWRTGTVLKMLRREGALHAPTPIISGRVPYGWERASGLDPKGTRGMRPVPAEQAAIRRMVALRLSGRSLNEIAGVMEREHRPTKYGGKWCSAGVAKVLSRVDAAPSQHPTRSVPFGWRRVVKGPGTVGAPLALDPAEQTTLKRAVTLWRHGHGAHAIARILNDEGRSARCGGKWHAGTVTAVVRRARTRGRQQLESIGRA